MEPVQETIRNSKRVENLDLPPSFPRSRLPELKSDVSSVNPFVTQPLTVKTRFKSFIEAAGRDGVNSLIKEFGHMKVLWLLKNSAPGKFPELTNHLPPHWLAPFK